MLERHAERKYNIVLCAFFVSTVMYVFSLMNKASWKHSLPNQNHSVSSKDPSGLLLMHLKEHCTANWRNHGKCSCVQLDLRSSYSLWASIFNMRISFWKVCAFEVLQYPWYVHVLYGNNSTMQYDAFREKIRGVWLYSRQCWYQLIVTQIRNINFTTECRINYWGSIIRSEGVTCDTVVCHHHQIYTSHILRLPAHTVMVRPLLVTGWVPIYTNPNKDAKCQPQCSFRQLLASQLCTLCNM